MSVSHHRLKMAQLYCVQKCKRAKVSNRKNRTILINVTVDVHANSSSKAWHQKSSNSGHSILMLRHERGRAVCLLLHVKWKQRNSIIPVKYNHLRPMWPEAFALRGPKAYYTHTMCTWCAGRLSVSVWVCEWGGIEGDCLSLASNRSTVLKLPQSEEIAAFSWQGDWRDRPAGQTTDKSNVWTLLFHMDRRVVLTGTVNQKGVFLFFVFLSVMTKNALSGQDFLFFFLFSLDWLCADWCDDCVICRLCNNCPLSGYKDCPGLETHFKLGVLKEYMVR